MSTPLRRGAVSAWSMLALLSACDCGEEPRAAPDDSAERMAKAPYRAWRPPTHAVRHLAEIEGTVTGPAPAAPAPLARFGEAELAAWTRTVNADGVTYASAWSDTPTKDVGRVTARFVPRGAREVVVAPLCARKNLAVERDHRSVRVLLERGLPPDVPVNLEFDVAEAANRGWSDAGETEHGVRSFEVSFVGSTEARLDEVVVHGEASTYLAMATRRIRATHEGRVRPSWLVSAGASVALPVDIPAGRPELRWHDTTVSADEAAPAPRTIRVRDGERTTELHTSTGPGSPQLQRASLEPWAGRRVTVELTHGPGGTAFFGDPRIVTPRGGNAPNVLVYLIDTLRADAVGAFGAPAPNASPNLDRLASEGVAFSMAIASSCWTKPAIVSLMSGFWETTHGIGTRNYTERAPETLPLLQEAFRRAGWRTANFSASVLGAALSGLDRGFGAVHGPEFWSSGSRRPQLGSFPSAPQLHDALLEWIEEERDQPFFAYVHTLEVHEYRRYRRESYERQVRTADEKLGDLLAALRARGLDDNLLVVVTSDHGESFGEGGFRGHGTSVRQEQVRIPLVFWAGEALPHRTVRQSVGFADIGATLLDLVGLPQNDASDGRSFRRHIDGTPGTPHDFAPSSLVRFVWTPNAPQQRSVVQTEGWKAIWTAPDAVQAFDLRTDPNERAPLGRVPEGVGAELQEWRASEGARDTGFSSRFGRSETPGAVDATDLRSLQALGYVQ